MFIFHTFGVNKKNSPSLSYAVSDRLQVIECFRRIMLTGAVVFIFPGAAAQIAVTIVISFVFFVISETTRPYESVVETFVFRAGHVVLFFSFFAALLYKVDVSNESEASQEALGIVLVVVHIILVLAVFCHAFGTWVGREKEDPLPRRATSGRVPPSTVKLDRLA